MKKYLLILIFAISLSQISIASPSVSIESVVGNKYLTFGSGGPLSEHSTLQNNLNVGWKNGFYANFWVSRPLARGVDKSDYSNENDYAVGWNGDLDYWSLGASVTYFDEPRLTSMGAGDIWFTSLKASHGMGPVTLDLGYNTYTPRSGSGFEGGHLISVGFSKKFEWQERVSLSAFAKVAYDDGGFGLDKGLMLNVGGEISWKIGKGFSLIAPRVEGFSPITVRDVRKKDAMWWVGLAWSH